MFNFYTRWKRQSPSRFISKAVKVVAYLDTFFLDHGVLRLLWNGPEQVTPNLWRSNQPSSRQIARLAKSGVKTVVNLRGSGHTPSFIAEKESCSRHKLQLIEFKMSSRGAPVRSKLLELDALIKNCSKPVLFHCKSGADRSGFAAALYLLLTGEGSIEQARAQLSWRYLHFKGAKTGRLDAFLAAYQRAHEATGVDLLTWVQTEYDPDEINRNFKPKGLSSWLVDRVLRRE